MRVKLIGNRLSWFLLSPPSFLLSNTPVAQFLEHAGLT